VVAQARLVAVAGGKFLELDWLEHNLRGGKALQYTGTGGGVGVGSLSESEISSIWVNFS
jgi:hypothetical protein